MGKLCSIHKTKLRKHSVQPSIHEYMAFFTKFYNCEKCIYTFLKNDLDGSTAVNKLHIYCYLCDSVYIHGQHEMISVVDHNRTYHYFIVNQCSTRPSRFFKTSMYGLMYIALVDAIRNDPQLVALAPSHIDMPEEINNLSRGDYTLDSSEVSLLADAVSDHLQSKSYSCVFCKEEYDAFPSLKIARKHMKCCPVLLNPAADTLNGL